MMPIPIDARVHRARKRIVRAGSRIEYFHVAMQDGDPTVYVWTSKFEHPAEIPDGAFRIGKDGVAQDGDNARFLDFMLGQGMTNVETGQLVRRIRAAWKESPGA